MIDAGLEKEAKNVHHKKQLTSLKTVGYQELFSYFDGEISKEKAIELIKRNSRRYARKQITWFRRDEEVKWFSPQQTSEIIEWIESQLC
jgi:tRNA dimethylallyltransferase